MNKRNTLKIVLAALLLLGVAPALLLPAQAQGTSRLFPEIGKTVRGAFLRYWNSQGGLARQGFPISDEIREVSETDGKAYTVQYFERARLELHPELAATPYEVLSSLLGVWQYNALYGPEGAATQKPNTGSGSVLFRETGKRVGSAFLQYWERNGGLPQFGYPIFAECHNGYTQGVAKRQEQDLHDNEDW